MAETVFNEGSIDGTDFRIESDDNANMFFVDGADDRIGIGVNSPTTTLNISKATTSTDGGVYPSLKIENTSAGSGNSYANIVLHGGNGTTQFSILNDGRSSNSAVTLRTDSSSPINFLTNGSTAFVLGTSQQATFSGAVYVPEYIYHDGDTNTSIRFLPDNVITYAGGNNCIDVGTSEIRFNHDQQNIDFAIESNDNGNMFVVDAGENKVAIGGNTYWASPSGSSSGSLAHVTIAGSLRLDSQSTSTGSGTEIDSIQFCKAHGSGTGVARYTMAEIRSFTNGGYESGLNFYTSASTGGGGYDISKRFVISGPGEIYINRDSSPTSMLNINTADGRYGLMVDDTFGNNALCLFQDNGSGIGSITIVSGATAYNTSSDYRLKENQVTLANGLDRLNKLKPYNFNFIAHPDIEQDGFFAHEVAEVVPTAVSGKKDAVDENKGIDPQQLDQSKLVPLLVKAVQELSAEVEDLKKKNVMRFGN
jgi:hypothetical protein